MPSTAVAAVPDKRRILTRGPRVIRFIERHCVHTKGRWLGRPFRLLPWQRDWIMELFELDPETRRRRYRWALLGVPKKNGKTELVAALGLYFLLADGEPTPEVVCAAASKEQAGLIFGAAKTMVQQSPTLSRLVAGGEIKVWTSSIESVSNGGKMYVVAAAVGTNDGKNISALLIDELHEWIQPKSIAMWTTLTGGAQWREEPITVQITTAGILDPESLWYREYSRGKAIARGEAQDDSYHFRWYEAAPEDPYDSVDTWRASNPSFDALSLEAPLRDLFRKRTPNQFKRYHLNMATDAAESWLREGAWDACRVKSARMDPDAETWVAVDCSANSDSVSVSWGQWAKGDDGRRRFLTRTKLWTPPIDPHTGQDQDDWEAPLAEVENFLRELARTFATLEQVAFDPYNFRRSASILDDEGLPMLEFPQHPSRTAPATKLLRDMIHSVELAHEGDPRVRAQVVAAVIVPVSDGNQSFRLSKGKSRKRIDAAASLMMLVGTAIGIEEEPEKVPGVIVI